MSTTRRAFNTDPDLARRLSENLARATGLGAEDRQLIMALRDLYAGGDVRYLNFYGPPGTIETIPYHVVAGRAERAGGMSMPDLTNRVVFVGFSDLYDPGQPDRFYTVFTRDDGVDLSGVEIAATAFANLLAGRAIAPADTWIAALILLAFGLAVGGCAYLLPAIAGVPGALSLGVGYGIAAQYAFSAADHWLPLATPILIQLPAAVFVGLATQYLLERRQKRRVTQTISYYLPESVAKELTRTGFDPASLNKIVQGTCLATDMAGFTSISERLGPEELASFMNAYFEALAEPLKRHKADVTEFHADTIMCAWLTPDGDVAARRHAALAALDVIRTVREFGRDRSLNTFTARVGLENGRFYLGHAGGGGRLSYSILGDCANTASRLEGLNKQLGTNLLATESAVAKLDDLLTRPLGLFRFVGKSEARPVLEVLGSNTTASPEQRDICDSFAEALDAFQAGRWAAAASLFESHLVRFAQDGPAKFFLERCRSYQTDPPAEDPAIVRLDSK
jgi:adenylate cyclase